VILQASWTANRRLALVESFMRALSRAFTLAAAAGCGGVLIARSLRRRRNLESLQGKTVLITGGSRGLGLLLAREFARRGSRVAICARNADQLERAREDLRSRGADVWARTCDVSDPEEVRQFVAALTGQFGPVDVLVNNAGIIQVGPASCMTAEDYDRALKTIFWGALNMILAILPEMRARRSGRIVNITSVGGKVSVPHLLPYACAKFALVALSEGLRAELAADGIAVTTVVPGLMRTGSHVNAEFKGRQGEESTWFGLSASLPVISVDAERAARIIVRATERGKAEQIISLPAVVLSSLNGLFPGLTASLLSLVNQFILPTPEGGESAAMPGKDIFSQSHSSLLEAIMRFGEAAAKQYNQL
jgi:NAD(P)-dependent dehydrogenase (short-subunit alcohol dehydrogenase family)